MKDEPEDLDALAAEYVLGTLEGADLARAEALEAVAADFRQKVAQWRLHFLALDDTAPAAPPPDRLWAAIETGLAQKPRPIAAKPILRAETLIERLWSAIGFWRPVAIAASLASVVLAAGLIARLQSGPESPIHVAVLTTGEGKPAAIVNVYADGTTELVPLEALRAPEGRVIEIWTLQNPQQGPTSIGKLDSVRRIRLNLDKLSKPEANNLFELTLEPSGGSPTGKPTGPVLMKGFAVKSI